jgi:Ca-activated chloride channel family protein
MRAMRLAGGIVFAAVIIIFGAAILRLARNAPTSADFRGAEAEAPASDRATTVALILDTSGSMNEGVRGGGGSRIGVAKAVLLDDFLPLIADDVHLGFYRFWESDGACVLPPRRAASPVPKAERWRHREAIMEEVERIDVRGQTPIAASLRRARDDIEDYQGKKIIVLITDGQESFEGEEGVLREIRKNRDAGIETFVIGFNLGGAGSSYLESELGRGRGFLAADGGRDELLAALTPVLARIEQ